MSRPDSSRSRRVLTRTLTWPVALLACTHLALADDTPKPKPQISADHAAQMAKGLALFKGDKGVRAILSEHCVKCHGGESTKAEFDLTSREALLKDHGDGPAVVVGKSTESRLQQYLTHELKPGMPYKAKKLPRDAIDKVAAWIDAGAPYDEPLVKQGVTGAPAKAITPVDRDYWAFRTLKNVPPPKGNDPKGWGRSPIDAFLLEKLRANKIEPNPRADRLTLIRRATFDLTGLPPTPGEIDAFLDDRADDQAAYAKVIDRLLASPRYGERWARHWLDLARFGESHGFEHDYDRATAFHFRDFVIRALNEDMPYDRFVQLQLAGDEIEPENPLALMATGYLAAGVHSTQITANTAEKERYDELDDIAGTIGTSMLGLTIGCARCHDHKFDPILSSDYYRMVANFTTTVRSEVDLDLEPEATKKAQAAYESAHRPLVHAREKYEADVLPGKLEAWLKSKPKLPTPDWYVLEPSSLKSGGGAKFETLDDGSHLATGPNATLDGYTLTAPAPLGTITAVRLEALAHPSLVKGGPGRAANGNFALSDVKLKYVPIDARKDAKPVDLKLIKPRATFEQKGLPIAAALDQDGTSAWAIDPQFGKDHAAIFALETPLKMEKGATLTLSLSFSNNASHSLGRFRVSVASVPEAGLAFGGRSAPMGLTTKIASLVAKPHADLNTSEKAELIRFYRTLDDGWKKLDDAVTAHAKDAPRPKLAKVLVSSEGLPAVRLHTQGADFFEPTYFLKRGDLAQKIAPAPAGFLTVLNRAPDPESHWKAQPPKGWRTSYRRTALAHWMTDLDEGAGSLVARVIANRLWQHHFGRGIVATPSDFGRQGEAPTHPELLDWLANELIRNNWRLKPLHKSILLSSAYTQTSAADAVRSKIDPDAKLVWRHRGRRLEAEAIRDAMLSVSGLMDPTMYGPGSLDESMKRRSVYFTMKRSKLIPILVLFDAPDGNTGVGRRPETTIAPQALALLNNPQVRSYARGLAQRLKPVAAESPSGAVSLAYRLALGREPDADELTASLDFLLRQAQAHPGPDLEPALADFAQALLGLNEFIYIN